jgi:hypothetical protein
MDVAIGIADLTMPRNAPDLRNSWKCGAAVVTEMAMRRFVGLALSVFAVVIYAACGSDATGIDECRQIETARCQAAPACPSINLGVPPYATNQVDGCIAFYKDACLHGLQVADPGTPAIAACVKAIQATPTDCFTVAFPQTNPACSWLAPVVVIDASDDTADATDSAALDATDGATD